MQLTFTGHHPHDLFPHFIRVLGGEMALPRGPVRITFLGAGWEDDVMLWATEGRHDMFRLAWMKRKLDMTDQHKMIRSDAYDDAPGGTDGIVKRFGLPSGIRVVF